MDLGGPEILSKILSPAELEQIPVVVHDKIKNYIDGFFEEYCREKATANRLHDYEKKTEDLQSQIEDYEVKILNYEKNVSELRVQLDNVSSERVHLLELSNSYEKEKTSLRNEKNKIADDRDALMKVVERQNSELDRVQQELRSYQLQLKNAISAKCEAIARVDGIEGKEASIEFKERRMEQERSMLQNQIQTLTEDLNRNISELQNIRRDHTMQNMHLEARLTEKVEELKIAETQCAQYKETIERLTQNVQELSNKLFNQNEEANKMMDFYKKELDAKTKLTELYKGNCDDIDVERNELSSAIADLKRMLSEASEQYGELETKYKATLLQYEQDIEEKDKFIESQKSEILNANELLKELQHETVENAISKLAPSAAVASRLIRSDMSLTELYTLYVKTTEECELQKRENSRLNLQLKTILQELSENAPMIKKQEIDYEKLIETNNILVQQRDEMLAKKVDMEEVMANAESKISHLQRENKKLKHLQSDVSRQVCYLLKEIEQLRSGYLIGASSCNSTFSTDEIISKNLVTFGNIAELQDNNEKLLLLVRDLSTKIEEADTLKQQLNTASYQEKIEQYAKKIQSMQDMLNQQNNTVATLVNKCERYKKMYFELQKRLNESAIADISDTEGDSFMADASAAREKRQALVNTSDSTKKSTECTSDRRMRDLEQQVLDIKDQYKRLKEQHEYYTKEKQNNEKILNEQFDSMRTEVRELTSTNCKLLSSLEYTKEQIKLQQKNISTYKQQISTLEDRNKNYESTIIKHEQTVHYLKDEIMKTQQGYATMDTELNHLRHENRLLKDTIARLQSEKEGYYREHQNQSLLLNNLEIIKSNLERSEVEGRARLEQRLDETVRELSAQRRRFQEEEDRFRETTNDLKRQTEAAKQRMEDEKSQADKLRAELIAIRDELTAKSNKIDELSRKLQESLTPSKNDNPIALANKRARELEVKLEEANIEIASLKTDLAKAREHTEQYYKMSQSAETEIKNLHDVHTAFVAKSELEIKELKSVELNLKSRIAELESDVQLAAIVQTNSTESDQLGKTKEELKDALQKLSECNRNLRSLRSENSSLSETLSTVEQKYANEMILHSTDIQEFTKFKTEYVKVQDQVNELKADRDAARAAYNELKKTNEASLRLLEKEKEDLEMRVADINTLNSNLHDQIEALTNKMSLMSQTTLNNSSNNESVMDMSASDVNRSTFEEDGKNFDQMLQIVKYLRKEKDLTDAKLDILKAENTRLLSENTMLQKKVDEIQGFLNQERTKSQTTLSSASKHEEILRKIETLNAITDSNRILREERNNLAQRVNELNERISSVEDELFPQQNQNRELSMKVEELSTENTSLRTEAIKWRQRANVLVEKSNKNPEEFKRLQMERESLAKMLTADKENLKKMSEELEAMKRERVHLETEHAALEKQLQATNDDKKKIGDDFASLKQNNIRMMQEVMELKNKLLQREEAVQKLTEDLESKEAQLHESKNKEVQIRKIAKRYKDSFMELTNKPTSADSGQVSTENVELAANNVADASLNAAVNAELEQCRTTIEGLNSVISTTQEENEKLRKEIEELRTAVVAEDQNVEANNALIGELDATKKKLQEVVKASENQDVTVNNLRSQYEEAIGRLTRENESMLMRINQLNRQQQQQSTKPSTSSVAITEKSCISESSPRTANVKPMSGSTTGQQSATVTPWRGSETPLASIRPISVQNSRTAAILPTSQQPSVGGTTTSSSSSSSSNTALVPPQQQVHTTGSSSIESMSSSPTSSHTDYMPSTSSTSVAVAAIPPMGSASAAESSQEAESVQQQQQNDAQLLVSGAQQQVVALVSPRVEGSSQSAPSPNLQLQQEPINQQPSTSGSSGFTPHISVSSHIRHTPSSSNVTTSQPGCSGGHKRPRDLEGDSPTTNEDCLPEKLKKHPKLMRAPQHEGEPATQAGVTDSEVEYQVPTSSQRDQEDDIVVVDSDGDDGMAEADDGPADGEAEHEGYEDSYEQDQDIDEVECPEINESNIRAHVEVDNNEVDVDECNQVQCTSEIDTLPNDPSTSQAAAEAMARSQQQDNHQQSQTISSGSSESNINVMQPNTLPWMQASSSGTTLTRQQKATLKMLQQGVETNVAEGSNMLGSSRRSDSSPQGSKFDYNDDSQSKTIENESVDENVVGGEDFMSDDNGQKSAQNMAPDEVSKTGGEAPLANVEGGNESEEEFSEEVVTENVDNESHHSSGATQSEMQEIQQSQVGATSEDNEGIDGVSSEGEKQAVEDLEEEGREAEATTSPSINTRSKSTKAAPARRSRGFQRGGRPTPIVWQESPGNSRNALLNQRNQEQPPGSPLRGFPNQRTQRGRRMRRPAAGNYTNMRYS